MFTPITREEMERVLFDLGFQQMQLEGTVELVYGKIVRENNQVFCIRVYTTINPDGKSRAENEDAIRICLYWKNSNKDNQITNIGVNRRVYRRENWRNNLVKALDEAMLSCDFCPKCGSPMAERKNSRDKSKFLGCVQYPECRGTKSK